MCTSLSSLNTIITEDDWEDTFRSLGPKFSHLADLAGGRLDEDEEEPVADVEKVQDGENATDISLQKADNKPKYSYPSKRKYISPPINVKPNQFSYNSVEQDGQTTDSGNMSCTNTSSAVDGGDEDSTDGTEI